MKLISNASILCITHESITSLDSLPDFEDRVIKLLPKVCKDNIDTIIANIPNGIADEFSIAQIFRQFLHSA